jgi:outer membrane protein
MKKLLQTLSLLGAFGVSSLVAQAQPALKVAVVDVAKVFSSHYEAIAFFAKLKIDAGKAQDEIEQQKKEFQGMLEQYKELDEQGKNPAASADAKAKATADAQKKYQEVQTKNEEINNLAKTAQGEFQARMQNFTGKTVEQITRIATEIAKRDGATLLIDKSPPSAQGLAAVIYTDPAFDITDAVIAEINKNRPAASVVPAAPAAASTSDAPSQITVPGIKN